MHDKLNWFILKNNLINGGNNHAKSEKERIEKKLAKIEETKEKIGCKKHRKLQKYSDKFNEIFTFFLMSYRTGLLTFCGSDVKIEFNLNSDDGKFGFRRFENGEVKIHDLKSCHPNILKAVIIGKKSWGLFLKQWVEGVVENSFTKEELLKQFEDNNIKVPEPFLLDFENSIMKKKIERNNKELERLRMIGIL